VLQLVAHVMSFLSLVYLSGEQRVKCGETMRNGVRDERMSAKNNDRDNDYMAVMKRQG
jgi:hypothetical protein